VDGERGEGHGRDRLEHGTLHGDETETGWLREVGGLERGRALFLGLVGCERNVSDEVCPRDTVRGSDCAPSAASGVPAPSTIQLTEPRGHNRAECLSNVAR
jgi:hypothetical protein